ncbi:hypothetical protein SEA_BOBBOB_45 [Gordonia phage BobBob]|uniref:Uncharacterized protein n=2 Tax=Vividuovirus TaxID=2560251 RepID=A0A2L0HJL5_9CAUD|nr:hypothetical protein FDJ33_gp49 [Gordonia phage Brandonk123]YP_010099457.1 hypothetical protein KNU21_gp42 [Gordonia phage Nordenberg]QWT30177.1 hypothetical protein SEA_SEDONA_47 [Gordonia phage Sedona]UVF60733.1 hypothetical protein SEA_BOBBOB_45 [Gordonia phage BobBob]UYL87722.1 hypothetical protein SEA_SHIVANISHOLA_47 [Gordonia phage Shivanishola]AUX81886.1 hypothetical protein SEA_BRANDONK123_49 [Gordonia phage Brandonk123]AYR03106.1 hypothetical protein SEA_NORDENBERG_42 [Gordonia ph
MSACSSCGETIIFAKTAKGKSMPLDPEPNATRGNVYVTGQGRDMTATTLTDALAQRFREDGKLLYLSHFATCPNANRHRRGGRR